MSLEIRVTDNAAQVLRQIEEFPARMAKGIAAVLDQQNELTIGYAQANKLSRRGPTTLGVVSNRLRLSLRKANAEISGARVYSSIGSNVVYAGVHEHGFDGPVQVRSHMRRVPSRDLFSRGPRGGTKRSASGIARVAAFSRHMKMPARPYVSSSVEERQQIYVTEISAAILESWQQGGAS